MTKAWVPRLPQLGVDCASGYRPRRKPAERIARELARVYRHVQLVRFTGSGADRQERVVLELRDGKKVA